jgi:RNA-binding protein Musashi
MQLLLNKLKRKARGFGFVTFDSQEAADKVLDKSFHELKGIRVETKNNAEPRRSMVRGSKSHRIPANS